jgi:hypothetical protein
MTSTEAIKKIKVLLGIEKFEATANLADGTPVHVDTDFEVGATLHVVQEDGTFVPAPEGEHLLEDGRKLYVDAAGVITAIEEESTEEEAAPAEAPVAEETLEEVVVEDVPETIAPVTEEIVAAVVEAIAPVLEEVEALKAQLEALSGKFQKFSNEPAATPVRNNFKEENKKAKDLQQTRFDALVSIRNKR